jgi:hypothetical protein
MAYPPENLAIKINVNHNKTGCLFQSPKVADLKTPSWSLRPRFWPGKSDAGFESNNHGFS